MPYVRQKTWLPLAPRIKGLSVKESPWGFRRGMGADTSEMGDLSATLLGDCFDANGNSIPCGSASSGLTIVNPLQAPSTQQFPVSAATPGTANPLGSWLQQNQGLLLAIGGGLFGLALLKGFSR